MPGAYPLLCPHTSSQRVTSLTSETHNIRHSNDTQAMFWEHAVDHSNSALHEAVGKNHADVVQVLIDAGADIEKKNSFGRTPLLLACFKGYLDAVKVLVQARAELGVTDDNGNTCLIAASSGGHTETVRYLVGLGQVDVDQVGGPDATTALQMAAGHNYADVVEVLIDARADVGLVLLILNTPY